jgi:hypothetical protein
MGYAALTNRSCAPASQIRASGEAMLADGEVARRRKEALVELPRFPPPPKPA